MIGPPPRSPLFPTTTLFRSLRAPRTQVQRRRDPPRQRVLVSGPSREQRLPNARRQAAGKGAHRRETPRREYEGDRASRSEEHTSELQSPCNLVCRLLLEKKN